MLLLHEAKKKARVKEVKVEQEAKEAKEE